MKDKSEQAERISTILSISSSLGYMEWVRPAKMIRGSQWRGSSFICQLIQFFPRSPNWFAHLLTPFLNHFAGESDLWHRLKPLQISVTFLLNISADHLSERDRSIHVGLWIGAASRSMDRFLIGKPVFQFTHCWTICTINPYLSRFSV